MVKGGCTCPKWKRATSDFAIARNYNARGKHYGKYGVRAGTFGITGNVRFYNFYFCPWCGSPLTPPEEDGNEAE